MVSSQGLKQRQSQLEMVTAVSRALQDERFMVIEAPTGTGKTFAYLAPSILWASSQGEPVVISTHTRLLQDQMIADLGRLQGTLGIPFQAQLFWTFDKVVDIS
ncbi:MAG: DEAD/DEAH box helicase [Anaerolineales bacterium]|nr:DEAD/DEAH box helicase [Anaerolineales bacterium]